MSGGISDLGVLLRSMQAVLNEGCYVYCQVDDLGTVPLEQIIALIREPEGITLILTEANAFELGLPIRFRAAWITLQVHSDLAAVGLTAAFSTALGDAGISCNVIAGALHDHIFVPIDQGQRALRVLNELQSISGRQEKS
ncbi:MAG: ACT domain-containing protein [Lysobacterales bacterium]